MTLNEKFDKIFCINLIDRPDRRERFKERAENLGIDFEFFDAVQYGYSPLFLEKYKENRHDLVYPNEIGCAMSHYSLIKYANYKGYKNIFIFEDDTVFLDSFNDDIGYYLNELPNDWDLFYLYIMMYKWPSNRVTDYIINPKIWDKFLYRPKDAHCTSAYGINNKMFDHIINYMDNNFRIIDSYYRVIQDDNRYNIYACYPNLTSQEFDASNIRGDGKTTPKLDYFSNIVTFGEYKKIDYR